MTEIFDHNWANAVVIDTEWSTAIVRSIDDEAEERLGLVSRPRRTIQLRWTGLSQADTSRLLFYLHRIGDERVYVPLYCDECTVTATSSGTTIYCDTTLRRFHAGGSVAVYQPSPDGPTSPEIATIDSITDTQINLTGALSGSFPAGAVVVPLALAEIVLESDFVAFSDYYSDVALTFVEVLESSLPARAAFADLATDGYTTLGSYYVLDTPINWAQPIKMTVQRTGSAQILGRSGKVQTQGPRPFLRFELPLGVLSRDEFDRALRFFDAHQGRLLPWVLINPLTLWEPTGVATTYVDVTEFGDVAGAQDFVTYVAIETTSAVYVRSVSGVTDLGGTWRIALGAVIPAIALADIIRVTTAHFVRFATDSMREEWLTTEVVNVKLEAVEIPVDEAVDITLNTDCDCISTEPI